jgi:chitodextrinase
MAKSTALIVIVLSALSFTTQTYATTETVSLIRQNCTGFTNCYTSLATWEAARQRDLVAADEVEVARIEGNWSSPDTTVLLVDGWTTDSSRYIKIYTAPDARHAGVWDDTKYRLAASAFGGAIQVGESNVIIDGLQVENTRNNNDIAGISAFLALSNVTIKNNIVRYQQTVNTIGTGIAFSGSGNGTNYFTNNIVYGFPVVGIYARGGTSSTGWAVVYNNTCVNNGSGFRARDGFVLFKNNVAFNNINGAFYSNGSGAHASSTHNAGDTGTIPGSNPLALSGLTGNSLFRNYPNMDFHILNSAVLANTGLNLSTDPLHIHAFDIDGDARSGNWDIGADELPGGFSTNDTTPPSIPANLVANVVSSSQINLTWALSTDNIAVAGYRVFRNGAEVATTMSNTYSNSGLVPSTTYSYSVLAYDASGNVSVQSGAVSARTLASTASISTTPIIFDQFEYLVGREDPNAPQLFMNNGWSWAKTQQSTNGALGYLYTVDAIPGYTGQFPGGGSRVLAIEALPGVFGGQTDFYLKYGGEAYPRETVPGNVWFQFWIYVNNYGDQQSQIGTRDKFIYPCDGYYPCSASTGGGNKWLFEVGASINGTNPNGLPSPGNLYMYSRDNTVGDVNNSLAPSGDQSKLSQQDTVNHIRPNTWTLVKLHWDTSTSNGTWEAWITPMGQPTVKISEWISGVTPNFTWLIPDQYVGGHRQFVMPSTIPGPNNSEYYNFWIYMDDFVMASSQEALPVYDTPPPSSDTQAPTISISSPTQSSTVSGTTITVLATAADNIGVSGVQFMMDGNNLGVEDTTSPYSVIWDSTQMTNGSHTLSARARDAAGNRTVSSPITVNVSNIVPDITAPSMPTNLSATAFSSSQINLSWTPSTDAQGVSGYWIYRNGSPIATTTGSFYQSTGLSAETTYTYTVSAYDAADNVSAQSSSVSATTLSTSNTDSAVYPLQIIQPQANLTTHSRYYKAYPGLLYKVPVGVFGGVYPFTYALISAPIGMTIDANSGVISWPNPTTAGSPHPVTVSVTDAAGTTVSRSWTITVTTSGFIFVDGTSGTHALGFGCSTNCGTGTIDNPFRSMNDFYQASGPQILATSNDSWRNNNFVNYFVYWRAGTYGLEGAFNSSGQQFDMLYRGNSKPHVWLAYPGETVIIDHSIIPGTNGAFLDNRDGDSSDFYVQGITFRNMLNHAWRMGSYDRHTFFENRFENLGPGRDGDNSSFIMWTRGAPLYADNALVKDNIFDGLNIGAFIKTYSMRYGVFESNTFLHGNTTSGGLEGIALKNDSRFMDVRNNIFDGNFGDGAINGNWNDCGDLEIRFNKVLNSPSQTYSSTVAGYAIQMNHDSVNTGAAYVHRNTFEGTVLLKFGNTGDGPFRVYNNVIVNENIGNPAGSHISTYSVVDPSVLILSNNLVGYAANNIIDNNGNLTSAFASSIGIHGYQLGTSTTPPADTMAPSVPANLAATAISHTQINLSWSASTDAVGVTGYRIYRNGTQVGTSMTTSFSNMGLTELTPYSFTVAAFDAAGNVSAQSANVSATTPEEPDTIAPTVSIETPASSSTVSGTSTAVTANASDNRFVAGVQFYLNDVSLGPEDTTSPFNFTWNTTTVPNGSHRIHARARDIAGNQTTSAPVTVNVSNSAADTIAPTASITAPISGATVSGASVIISTLASDNVAVAGVQIYIDGIAQGSEDTVSPYSTLWNSTRVTNGLHTISARARDTAGNITNTAISVMVNNVNDTSAPTIPTKLIATPVSTSQINLSWLASSDNVGVVGYFIFRNGNLIGKVKDTSYKSTRLKAGTSYTYTVAAYDAAGNVSLQSSTAQVSTFSVRSRVNRK